MFMVANGGVREPAHASPRPSAWAFEGRAAPSPSVAEPVPRGAGDLADDLSYSGVGEVQHVLAGVLACLLLDVVGDGVPAGVVRRGLDPEPEPRALAVVATGGDSCAPFDEQLREAHLAPGLVDSDGGAVGELGRTEHHLALSDDPLEPHRGALLAPGEVPGVGEPVQLGHDGMPGAWCG